MKEKVFKSVLLTINTNASNDLLHKYFTCINDFNNLFDIDRIMITKTSFINDVDSNNVNKFNDIVTYHVADLTLQELTFLTTSLKENDVQFYNKEREVK